jgi:hypothetical protein
MAGDLQLLFFLFYFDTASKTCYASPSLPAEGIITI